MTVPTPETLVRYFVEGRGWFYGRFVRADGGDAIVRHPMRGEVRIPLANVQPIPEVEDN